MEENPIKLKKELKKIVLLQSQYVIKKPLKISIEKIKFKKEQLLKEKWVFKLD